MIHRVNITIDRELHAKAKLHAKNIHYTDFSGLVSKLLVDDLRPRHPTPEIPRETPESDAALEDSLREAVKSLVPIVHRIRKANTKQRKNLPI
jgi:hypothetical protein